MIDIKAEFEKKLKELGFSYQCITDGVYVLSKNNGTNSILSAQLIYSEPIETVIQVSNNGNEIEAIGTFKLKLLNNIKEPYFLILALPNTSKQSVEFIIVPQMELIRRLNKENRISIDNQEVEIVFWLMLVRFLYDCTNLGVQGEWFFMSKGVNGRMADGTEWDYTEYLNRWNRLKMI